MMQQPSAPPGKTEATAIDIDKVGPSRIRMDTQEFADHPHETYRFMRENYGPMVPVLLAPNVPATLVISWHTARMILDDPVHFPADPRAWQVGIPGDCPILPMALWRPNVLHAGRASHVRLRAAVNAALDGINPHRLRDLVIRTAHPLIESFCGNGKVDLLAEYASPLVFTVINDLIGCTPGTGVRVADAMARMFNSTNGTETVEADLAAALGPMVAGKRLRPGNDITTRLLQFPADPGSEHTALSDEETMHQDVLLYGAAIEPTVNLVLNTTRHVITDPRFLSSTENVSSTVTAAMTEVLLYDPPMANFCLTYPPCPTVVKTEPEAQHIYQYIRVPANQPVLISLAACNNDPTVTTGEHAVNDSHLGWSTGPHACPKGGRDAATLIAQTAIEELLDTVPDLVPTGERVCRPGPFHRALAEFVVTFAPTTPLANPTEYRS